MSDLVEPPVRDGPAPDTVQLHLDLDGFEGPIDLLLTLAREQRVDLARLSILQLADQYLAFIAAARRLRLELAADYLVMAAWLAYLKSRLLLPDPPAEAEAAPGGQELADALAFQLRRLEAMQGAAVRLMARPQLFRDVFPRGAPEDITVRRTRGPADLTLDDLLQAYADHQKRQVRQGPLRFEPQDLYTVEEALRRLESMLGTLPDWAPLISLLPLDPVGSGLRGRSLLASTLLAALELAKGGRLELRQEAAFGPIHVRSAAA